MTDKQFEKIKKGLQFHSEGGIDNLCTMTETTLRIIIEDAIKEIEKENVILKKEVQWLDMAINYDFPIADKLAELEAQIEKMKCCGNCEHFNFNEPNYCHKGVYRERQYVCSEWEFGN